MIRPATLNDTTAACEVVVAAGMFTASEAALLPSLLGEVLSAEEVLRRFVVDTDEQDAVVGVAFWQPVEMADRVTDLTMIAIRPSEQGRGRGRALMAEAEAAAKSAGQRLMLVQTSGTEQYAGTRHFYTALGYDEEAKVRDYWQPGDDLVVFRKELMNQR